MKRCQREKIRVPCSVHFQGYNGLGSGRRESISRRSVMKRFCVAIFLFAACVSPAWCQTAEQKKATIAFLQKLQQSDGGFAVGESNKGEAKGSLRATTAALRALKHVGGEAKDRPGCTRF